MRQSPRATGSCTRKPAFALVLSLVFAVAVQGRGAEPVLSGEQQARLSQADRAMSDADRLYRQGHYQETVPFLLENLKIRREVLGPQHPTTLSSMNNLAVIHHKLGQYADARKLLEEALAVQRQVLPADDARISASLTNLGTQLQEVGDLAGAKKYFDEALDLEQKYRGEGHAQTAVAESRMGVLLQLMGHYTQARPHLQRSYEINLKLYGERHQSTAVSLSNLGALANDMGEYAAARSYFDRALLIEMQVLGAEHPYVGTVANNLGDLLMKLRDYANARAYFEEALKIFRASVGEKHLDVALELNNIGLSYAREGDAAKAREYLEQALAMRRELAGDKHPLVATSLTSLGELLLEEGHEDQAQQYYNQALAISLEATGEQSQPVATIRHHLASMLVDQGKFDQAERLYEATLATYRAKLGDSHPTTGSALKLLCDLDARQGRWSKASQRLEENRRLVRRHAAGALGGLSEIEQLQYLATEHTGPLHAGLTWALARPGDAEFANLSAGWLLNGKALTQEAVAQRTLLARDSKDPQVGAFARQLLEVRERLAARSFVKPVEGDAAKEETDRLKLEEGMLTRRLAAASNSGRQVDPWVDLGALRSTLADHSALVMIARFPLYKMGAKRHESAWQVEHYAAWWVPPAKSGAVQVIDLGPADAIEAAVAKARAAIDDGKAIVAGGEAAAEKAVGQQLAELSQLIWEPVQRALPKGTTKILLSPDASLWVVPWAALRLADGRYAVEEFEFQYLTSGRELVQQPLAAGKARPVIMANPNYDLSRKQTLAAAQAVLRKSPAADDLALRSVDTRQGLPKVARLPGTATEAASITPKLAQLTAADPLVYTDQYALESVFKVLARPQVVVLSTHGFVLQDQPARPSTRGLSVQSTTAPTTQESTVPTENPLVRCGMLLAGCNSTEPGAGDDGVLTGLEIVGTDLRGTDLVVLSACQTGLGHIQTGEGVSGLRQAFQLAGAKTVVATLWQIPDQETALLMGDFFTELVGGASKSAAMRGAQLARIRAMREQNNAAHPFYWAAFTVTGN